MITAHVYFPCIHGDHNGDLNKLTCFVSSELRSLIKVASGMDDKIAENIIGASRYNENTSEAVQSVFVRVSNPNFTGRSYELALAIADKLCRYGFDENSQYFASGCIEANGCGSVSEVDGTRQKIQLIAKIAKKGDWVFFPIENQKKLTQSEAEQIQNMRATGIHVTFLESMDFFNQPNKHNDSSKLFKSPILGGKVRFNRATLKRISVLLILILSVMFALFMFDLPPKVSSIGTEVDQTIKKQVLNVLEPVLVPTDAY